MKRSMATGDDDEFCDDIIATVARANSVKMDTANILPEIRASPCPIHTKTEAERRKELLYSTNTHGGHVSLSPRRRKKHAIKNITLQQVDKTSSQAPSFMLKTKKDDGDIHPSERQLTKRPVLPKHMSSKEFVMTWLLHGSAPSGSNHFPEIVKTDQQKTLRRSDVSE